LPYVDVRSLVKKTGGSQVVTGHPRFGHIKFRNNPVVRDIQATAREVVAEITYYDDKRTQLVGPIYGRWGDTEQPVDRSPFASTRDLAMVDFEFNGLPHELDLIMKYSEDESCYAFDNDSCLTPGWRKPQFLLENRAIDIKVHLVGTDVERTWWLRASHNGKESAIEVSLPPTPDSEGSESQ